MLKKLFDKFISFLGKLYQFSPSLGELETHFPHKENCSQKSNLECSSQELVEFAGSDPWVGGGFVRVQKKFLECPECKVKLRYID